MPLQSVDGQPHLAAKEAALNVMESHKQALNARDEKAIAKTLHFPHYRLTGNEVKIWPDHAAYFTDFCSRAGGDWAYTRWGELVVVQMSADKVHIDVEVLRYNSQDQLIACFRSLWIITEIEGRWAAQMRSSFAAA